MILAQREYPNLPPLLKLRDKFEVDELEHEILSSALEDDSLSSLNPFTASIIKTFPKFERSIQIPLHFKKLMSITPTKLDNNASILILVNVIDLGQKKPYYDESMFKLLPLQLFEMIHFSSYTQEIYSHHFRKLRLMKIKMSRLVKHGECKMKGEMMNDIKDANKRFNESKWTRQGLSLVTLRIEGVDHGPLKGVVMKDEEARLKKEISPWT